MKQVVIPELRTEAGYIIPGGWKAWVPEFFVDATYMQALTQALAPYHPEPEKEARRRMQDMGEVGFVSRLKDFIRRHADRYAKRFPHTRRPDRTLAGFDPERLQTRFIPGERSWGNNPKPYITKALTEMAAAS